MTLFDAPVALVDLDGTLCDYDGALRRGLAEIRGPGEPEDDGLTRTDGGYPPHLAARRRLITRVPGFWRHLEPLPLGFAILHELEAQGFRPHVLTKAPAAHSLAWMEKVDWCRQHVPHMPVILAEEKGVVDGRVLVDDWPPYVEQWLRGRPDGLAVVPAHPWNEDIEARVPGRCVRYDGSTPQALRARLAAVMAAARRRDEPPPPPRSRG